MIWIVFIPAALATILILLVSAFAVRFVAAWRRRDYVRHEDKSTEAFRSELKLPADRSDGWPKTIEPIVEQFRAVHQQAISAQHKYHAAVVSAATCIALTFCAMAISTTKAYGNQQLHLVILWVEFLSLLYLFANYKAGTDANKTWITYRIQAELRRQDQFIGLLLPGQSAQKAASSNLEIENIRAAIKQADAIDVVDKINKYWAARKRAIEQAQIEGDDLGGVAFLRYLHKRPVRQLGWFSDSISRLEHNAHSRSTRLMVLFSIAALLSFIKLALVLAHASDATQIAEACVCATDTGQWLTPAIIVVTGWSATEAAYYLNQNARSLIHRYRTQLTRMKRWFAEAQTQLPLADLPAKEFDLSGKVAARKLVLEFEDLMIEELIDWIHIARFDAIEIAP